MTQSPLSRPALLAGASLAAFALQPLAAQDAPAKPDATGAADASAQSSPPASSAPDGSGSIVVEARRLRGQLDVEQAPILELDEEDIAAEGVTSIADLITQITAQSGSARGRGGGGRPIVLVNGIRVGSFREFANYPPEALERVEVFPEEVAQRFGFAPDRRVINLILKDNYSNAEVEFEFEGPSRGGYTRTEQELGYLKIADGARINASVEASDTSALTEDERDIDQTRGSVSDIAGDPDQAAFRTLVADSRSLSGNLSWAKAIIDSGTSLSANANYTRIDDRSLSGLNSVRLTDPDGNSALRTFGADTPLEVVSASDQFAVSGSLTRPVGAFRLTSTVDAGLTERTRLIDRRFDTAELEARALDGTLAIDAPLPMAAIGGIDEDFTRTTSASSLTTLRGPLAQLPAGELIATFDVGYDWTRLESEDTRGAGAVRLTRGELSTGANLVVPITSRRNGFADALGSVTLSAQAGLQHLSDFGTLGDYTLSLNWSPIDDLDLSATYITREVAPGLAALGDPQVVTLNVPVFDFTNGETVLATLITGGNPDLQAETQRDWKFAANWELPFWDNARVTVEYVRNRSDDVTRTLPRISPQTEAAFPDRIVRDETGQLIAIDQRFVTFAETRADLIEFGLRFRGSIGAGEGRGGAARGGGEGQGGRPAQGRGPRGAAPEPSAPGAARPAGAPSAGQRAAFREFRARICADDGLDVLLRLIEAQARGDDLSGTIPDFDAARFERLLARVRGEDGEIEQERLEQLRERICRFDPSGAPGAGRADGAQGPAARAGRGAGAGRGGRGAFFAAFRSLACGEDGDARIRALVARIEAGEDVSDELPGYDPAMAGFVLERLRGEDGAIAPERIARMRARMCDGETPGGNSADGAGPARGGASGGGPPPGFNPLARRSFRGFRYFVSLNHTIALENEVLIAPGLAPLDQLDGESISAFGLPRHSSRLEAGIFGGGVGMRLSGRYTGKARIDGSGLPGSSELFIGDLARFDLRVFAELGQLLGDEDGVLKNLRVSLRTDNIFDARRRVVDANGDTPINYQPFLIDPVGRYVGIDIRKLF